ncbi:MAG: hypothetical protein ABIS39_05885 [Sphingomicrobium sp.]
MARHEKDFDPAGDAELSPREALSISAARGADYEPGSRVDALARFLSAEDGWIEAARRLDGAFARGPAVKQSEKD